MANNFVFNDSLPVAPLKLAALESCKDFACKVDSHIVQFRRLDMEKNMRNATNNAFSEFEVVYQPIVEVTRESYPCVGAEALIRWNSGELGLIAPTDFIPLAEYLGRITPIGA